MPKALRVCPTSGCPNLTSGGACDDCKRRRTQARGTPRERGYGGRRWTLRRAACLRRDPVCVCAIEGHDHLPGGCWRQSTVADHDPHERRDLVTLGVADPDALRYLKGKCKACHDRKTAGQTPGGWNARDGR